MVRTIGVCVVLASLTLLIADQPSYDVYAWLNWGRQIAHGGLDTTGGPSWKPLPVLATTGLSVLGDDAARLLWLVLARTAGLLALVLAFRLARGLSGIVGGVVACAGLATATDVAMFCSRGTSEALLVALVLGAVLLLLDDRRLSACGLIVLAALLRPEVWPLMAAGGLWLVWSAPTRRARAHRLAALTGAGVLVLAAWLLPEQLGSGEALRAASRALDPVAGTPAQASRPFVAVFTNSARALAWPLYAGAVLAVALAARRPRERAARVVLALAGTASVYMITVAVLAEGGFTGTLRYVTLPAALTAVLGGVGWGWLWQIARERATPRRALAAALVATGVVVPFLVLAALRTGRELRATQAAVRLYDELPSVLRRAGGAAAVRACAPVYTGPYQTQVLAWELHVPSRRIGIHPRPPGTRVWPASLTPRLDPAFPPRARSRRWTVSSTCVLRP